VNIKQFITWITTSGYTPTVAQACRKEIRQSTEISDNQAQLVLRKVLAKLEGSQKPKVAMPFGGHGIKVKLSRPRSLVI